MDDIAELARDIDRERRARLKRMSLRERFHAGGDLFDAACRITLAGIRSQHPEFSSEQVLDELNRRLERQRAREYRHLRDR